MADPRLVVVRSASAEWARLLIANCRPKFRILQEHLEAERISSGGCCRSRVRLGRKCRCDQGFECWSCAGYGVQRHGWVGLPTELRTSLTSSEGQGISLQALIDPKDVESKQHTPARPSLRTGNTKKRSVASILRRLLRLASRGQSSGTMTRPSTVYDAAEEMERNRRSRQDFMEKRKARGSIMYEKGEPKVYAVRDT